MTIAVLILAVLAGSVAPVMDTGSGKTLRGGGLTTRNVSDPVSITASILLGGKATHYCLPGQRGTSYCTRGYGPEDMVAAIDRKDTPWRKGDRVLVTHGRRSVVVTIVDTCGCPGSRLIDLTSGAFRQLAPLSRGVIAVELTDAASIRLPATDTDG